MIVFRSKKEIKRIIGELINEEVVDSANFMLIDMEDDELLTERANAQSILNQLFPEGMSLAGQHAIWYGDFSEAKLEHGRCFFHRFSSTTDFLKAVKLLHGDHVYGPATLFDDVLRWEKNRFRTDWHFDVVEHTLEKIDRYRLLCVQGEHYEEYLFLHPPELDKVMKIIAAP